MESSVSVTLPESINETCAKQVREKVVEKLCASFSVMSVCMCTKDKEREGKLLVFDDK